MIRVSGKRTDLCNTGHLLFGSGDEFGDETSGLVDIPTAKLEPIMKM